MMSYRRYSLKQPSSNRFYRERTTTNCLSDLKQKLEPNGFLDGFRFSFCNLFTMSLFDFVRFVLDKHCRLNWLFQGRYTDMSLMWDCVASLKLHFSRFIEKHAHQPTMGIPCLAGLCGDENDLFFETFKVLNMSHEMRFECPSTGAIVRQRVLQESATNNHPHHPPTRCSIQSAFDINNVPHFMVINNRIQPFVPPSMQREMIMLFHDINRQRDSILDKFWQRIARAEELAGFEIVSRLSLHDVFMVIERSKFPLLWREAMKLRTIIPTTVTCEQSFSVMKNLFHPNMKTTTFTANARNKIHERTERVRF